MNEDGYILLSALQHYLYCPRQCALIHLEQQWVENRYTAEGRLLHERSDKPASTHRKGIRTVSAMPLINVNLRISGIADIVEFHEEIDGKGETPYPVEYKRGRPKTHQADEVQLCAQALCLEAMFSKHLEEGSLYYGRARRRKRISFDGQLRSLTLKTISATRTMFLSNQTPPAYYDPKRCDHCSLINICLPKTLSKQRNVQKWIYKNS